jgi:hypothetical protein
MIARGMTNKEIAHELGSSERAVIAQVTRLLRRHGASNRASLVARVVAEQIPRGPTVPRVDFVASLLAALDVYTPMPFVVMATMGPTHTIVYLNAYVRRLAAPGRVADALGRPWHADHESLAALIRIADEVYRTGQAQTVIDHTVHWPRGDGAWAQATVQCAAQPILESAEVRGVLWICTI